MFMCCIFGLLNTTTCSGCPDQPSSGTAWIYKKSKGKRPLLANSRYKVVINNYDNYYSVCVSMSFAMVAVLAAETCSSVK